MMQASVCCPGCNEYRILKHPQLLKGRSGRCKTCAQRNRIKMKGSGIRPVSCIACGKTRDMTHSQALAYIEKGYQCFHCRWEYRRTEIIRKKQESLTVCPDCGHSRYLKPSQVRSLKYSGKCQPCAAKKESVGRSLKTEVVCPDCGKRRWIRPAMRRRLKLDGRCQKCAASLASRGERVLRKPLVCRICYRAKSVLPSHFKQIVNPLLWACRKCRRVDIVCPDCGLIRSMSLSIHIRHPGHRCKACANRNKNKKTFQTSSISSPNEFFTKISEAMKGLMP